MSEQDSERRKQAKTMMAHNPETAPQPAQASDNVMLPANLQARIGRELRAVYDEVLNEPVPDRFLKLLEELERKQADRS